jgi:hypothetical protein
MPDPISVGRSAISLNSPSSGERDAPASARLPGKREMPNAKVTDTFTNGVVPARSRPYYVNNENGGDSVEAHVGRAVAAARTRMVVTVECWLRPVNWSTRRLLPVFTLANIGLFITRGVFRFLASS